MSAVTFLKRVTGLNKLSTFDHAKAQKYEWANNEGTIRNDFAGVYAAVEANLSAGGLWHKAEDEFFGGDAALFAAFVDHVRARKCLEIGSGPFGFLPPARWIKDRVVIEPLADHYRRKQLELTGKTFFTDDIKATTSNAEDVLPELVGRVDGAIICRNALDHCEDALTILLNMSKYAAPGCYLLLWTDIWHLDGVDDGHHNITRSPEVMDALLRGLGFEVIKECDAVRPPGAYIEYGRVARKV